MSGAQFHVLLHLLVPLAVALAAAPRAGKSVGYLFMVMVATMLVDLDHLLATPIYDPERCSIGFHPLHSLPAIAVYAVMSVPMRTRWVGIGLLIHMALDATDCVF